jgi:hypothetical protein
MHVVPAEAYLEIYLGLESSLLSMFCFMCMMLAVACTGYLES